MHPPEWLTLKKTVPKVGKDINQWEFSYTAGGSVMWDNHWSWTLCYICRVFIATSFLIVGGKKLEKFKGISIMEWGNKSMFFQKDCSKPMEWHGLQLYATTWMNLTKINVEWKKPDIHAYLHYEIPYMQRESSSQRSRLFCGVRS